MLPSLGPVEPVFSGSGDLSRKGLRGESSSRAFRKLDMVSGSKSENTVSDAMDWSQSGLGEAEPFSSMGGSGAVLGGVRTGRSE